jgi:hypothetical protein
MIHWVYPPIVIHKQSLRVDAAIMNHVLYSALVSV